MTVHSSHAVMALNELGEKIFLDRYALKDMKKETLAVGDTVIVAVDKKTGQREVGSLTSLENNQAEVALRDGTNLILPLEHVDKPLETRPEQMAERVARAVAAEEEEDLRETWEKRFRWLMEGWRFVPGGRILTGAGTDQNLTYYNCYVIPSPVDSREGIMQTLTQMTEIMSRGGGVGINLSSLRPHHAYVRGVNGRSSGSVSWGGLYSFVTGLIEQGGSRRGALMLILDVWHPDISEFIESKLKAGKITNANISVGITDDFMEAVKGDEDWNLVFPDTSDPDYNTLWRGDLKAWKESGRRVIHHGTVKASDIWNKIISSAWASAEPGVFFTDRYNSMSNSWYYAPIRCTNPCGEQGLPDWGVCNLGSLNLSAFVGSGDVEWESLGQAVGYAVRFLDNIIDSTPYFFEENRARQMSERRIGLGTMGLAEMLVRLKIRYGSVECIDFLDRLYQFIAVKAYEAGADLAVEKGSFPLFDPEKFLQSGFVQGLPKEIRDKIASQGMRNVTLLTQAPTGSTGTMVGTSTGIEPYFFWEWERKGRMGTHVEKVDVYDEWKRENDGKSLPDYFVTAMDLSPEDHIKVQAAIQRWVDSSISKTSNTPHAYTVQQTRELYELMYDLGCKGGTVYRDGSREEQVLNVRKKEEDEKKKAVKARTRPTTLRGSTYRKHTPIGTAYITVNSEDKTWQEPFEVFVNVAKVGSDVAADAEGLGRLISLVLRMPSPLTPTERVKTIIAQLRGIGSGRQQGFGKQRVMSLPDAVAQALEEHIGEQKDEDLPKLPDEEDENASKQYDLSFSNGTGVTTDICPVCGNATLMYIEGCKKCHICGHSEC